MLIFHGVGYQYLHLPTVKEITHFTRTILSQVVMVPKTVSTNPASNQNPFH